MNIIKFALFAACGIILVAVFWDAIASRLAKKRSSSPHKQVTLLTNEEVLTPVKLKDDEALEAVTVKPISDEPVLNEAVSTQSPKKSREPSKDDIVMLSIHPKEAFFKGDINFLKALGSVGLSFGDKDIFHYYAKTDEGDEVLFSVAQLKQPGVFNIDNIEELECEGLLLFVDLLDVNDPEEAVEVMLHAAQTLAKQLEGTLYLGYNSAFTETTEAFLLEKARDYSQALLS